MSNEENIKDTIAEETPVEETPTEETPVEETPAEEVPTDEKPKKSKRAWTIVGIVSAAVVVILLGIYLGMSKHYEDRFFQGTMVNGEDCSGKTIKEVEAVLQSQVETYSLTMKEKGGQTETIKGTDMDIKYIGYSQIQEAFAEQNPYTWPKSLFEDRNIDAEIVFEYDEEKLDTLIAELNCMKKENQKAPVAAKVVLEDGEFVIKEEEYGTKIDKEKLSEVIHTSVTAMTKEIDLDSEGCYVQPKYTKDSKEVIDAQAKANKCLTTNITYSLDSIEVKVDKELVSQWVSVDEDMNVEVSNSKVKAFTKTLSKKYNTPGRSGVLVTPTGKEVKVKGAANGREVGTDAERKQLLKEIKAGTTVTRSPIIEREETPEGEYSWGTTYVEVDIAEQHMWYIKGGKVVFETDVVTGKKGKNDTPTGVYKILEKVKGKYLRGRLVNGKPSYVTWVDYWMRVTWSGIGFHDAPWQPRFGGDRYVSGGSHGCVNMPSDKAKEFYGMLKVGTPVIIHY